MMNIDGVIVLDKKSGITLYSNLNGGIEPELFSAFVAAVGHFAEDLAIGQLTSFTTKDKTVFVASRERTVTALVIPRSIEFQENYSLAHEIGQSFEEKYISIPSRPQPETYAGFGRIVDLHLKNKRYPFLRRVAHYAQKRFGGEVAIRPQLMKRDGSEAVIDILLDSRKKRSDIELANSTNELSTSAISQDITFFKVIDGVAGRGDVLDFMDSTGDFGIGIMKRGEMRIIPYPPARVVIVARDLAESAVDEVRVIPRNDEQPYLDLSGVYKGVKLKSVPREVQCTVELWKWHDDKGPERLGI